MPIIEQDGDYIVTSAKPDVIVPEKSIGEVLATKMAKHDPNAIAIIEANDGNEITYGQLQKTIRRFAAGLLEFGLVKEDLILLFGENSSEYAVSMVAATYLGCPFSPVRPANGPYEVSCQIDSSGSQVLLVDRDLLPVIKKMLDHSDYRSSLNQLKVIIILNEDKVDSSFDFNKLDKVAITTYNEVLEKGGQLNRIPYFDVKPDDMMMVVFTSGTTGQPKGAVHSSRTFLGSVLCYDPLVYFANQRVITWFPLGHITGIITLMSQLYNSITGILHRGIDFMKILSSVPQFQANMLPIASAFALPLAKGDFHERFDTSSLKAIIYAGSKIPSNLVEEIKKKFQVPLYEKYAATEFMGSVDNTDIENLKYGDLGPPCANVQLKIIDIDTGKSLPANQQGEICIRGAPRFVCYLHNKEATKQTIDAHGWYHSGDVGFFDDQGHLHMVDRLKELIKFKVWSVFPAEVEDYLLRHPAVAEVCVVGVKHITDGALLRAYVQIAQGKTITEQELIDLVNDNLGVQKRLHGGVRFVDNIPRTIIGKVDRAHFKALVKDELITEPVD